MSIYEELLSKSGINLEELNAKISEFLEKHPDLNKEMGAFFLAKEMGVEIDDSQIAISPLNLLDQNIKNANVLVTVVNAYPKKEFNTNNKKGALQNLVVTDNTSTMNLTIWNPKEDFTQGDVLLVTNAFVNEFKGVLKLNTSRLSTIKIKHREPQKQAGTEKKLGELDESDGFVNVEGRIDQKMPVGSFEKDGTQKQYLRFTISDKGFQTNCVAWDTAVKEMENIEEKSRIKVSGARVKANRGRLELHFGNTTKAEVLEKNIPEYIPPKAKISELGFNEVVELDVKIKNINNVRSWHFCKNCNTIMVRDGDKYTCPTCNAETENYLKATLVAEIEDESGYTSTVFRKKVLQELLKCEEQNLEKELETYDFKGKNLNINGYLHKSKYNNENEFIVLGVK